MRWWHPAISPPACLLPAAEARHWPRQDRYLLHRTSHVSLLSLPPLGFVHSTALLAESNDDLGMADGITVRLHRPQPEQPRVRSGAALRAS